MFCIHQIVWPLHYVSLVGQSSETKIAQFCYFLKYTFTLHCAKLVGRTQFFKHFFQAFIGGIMFLFKRNIFKPL
ncbi:MAG: hypothetical protein V3R25_06270, partial [Nitrosomonadaceae bacterium]